MVRRRTIAGVIGLPLPRIGAGQAMTPSRRFTATKAEEEGRMTAPVGLLANPQMRLPQHGRYSAGMRFAGSGTCGTVAGQLDPSDVQLEVGFECVDAHEISRFVGHVRW